jgi:hypothetical protein
MNYVTIKVCPASCSLLRHRSKHIPQQPNPEDPQSIFFPQWDALNSFPYKTNNTKVMCTLIFD